MLNESQLVETPESRTLMVSPRDYRLSSLTGYCLVFKKDVPIWVPPQIYKEAVVAGCVPAETQPEETHAAPKPVVHESLAEAQKLEHEAKLEHIETAIRIVMARGDSTDFKADGYPKANKVIAEVPPECPRPTAGEIQFVFDKLRENIDLAED